MNTPFTYLPPQPKSGWICPKCGRVYSPEWPACAPCNDKVKDNAPYGIGGPTA